MSLAQRAMQHPWLAPVYERAWRPVWFLSAMAFDVPHLLQEKQKAVRALRLAPGDRVLDVACGPGNFTREYADAVGPAGWAIGLDLSSPMLRRAVTHSSGTGASYVLGSAHALPFEDGEFDAVACHGALYLIPEPFRALDELVRVLRPGGRLAVMAAVAGGAGGFRRVARRVAEPTGLRVFAPASVPGRLRAAGFVDIETETHGFFQYVAGTAPGAGPAR